MALDFSAAGARLTGGDIFDATALPFTFGCWWLETTNTTTTSPMGKRAWPEDGWNLKSEQYSNTGQVGVTYTGFGGGEDNTSGISTVFNEWMFTLASFVSGTGIKYWVYRPSTDTLSTATSSGTISTSNGADPLGVGSATGDGDNDKGDPYVEFPFCAVGYTPANDGEVVAIAHQPLLFLDFAGAGASDYSLWHLNKTSGTIYDLAGNHNLTVVGSPVFTSGPPIMMRPPVHYSFAAAGAAPGGGPPPAFATGGMRMLGVGA